MDIRAAGKSRSQRINIDYYRTKNWLTRSRGLSALLAAAIAIGYCIYVYGSGGSSHLSTGPVASVHASFENDCRQCHLDFSPISSDSLRFTSSQALDRLEEACQKCHRVDHHFRYKMTPEFATLDQHCSDCHTDHEGRTNDLVNVASDKCVQCHGNLPPTCKPSTPSERRATIAGFSPESHGDFASLLNGDPGRVKFDHWQHMQPGAVDADSKGAFSFAMLEPKDRNRYRKSPDGVPQTDDAIVTLTCADCHAFAGTPSPRDGKSFVGDDEIGRHIAPIAFDQHCAACHSLNAIGRVEGTLPLPHAAPWKEVETLIAAKLVGGQQIGSIRMPRDAVRKTPLVGEGNAGAMKTAKDEVVAVEITNATVAMNVEAVRTRCLQCHEPGDITDEAMARSDSASPLIPDRWLRRGIYDHAAHRKIDCKFCHAGAYPQSPDAEQAAAKVDDSEVVMIGGIETCAGCHRDDDRTAPGSLIGVEAMLGGQGTWASDACIECHRYHWQPNQEVSLQ